MIATSLLDARVSYTRATGTAPRTGTVRALHVDPMTGRLWATIQPDVGGPFDTTLLISCAPVDPTGETGARTEVS